MKMKELTMESIKKPQL